jgi:hypothetical protein
MANWECNKYRNKKSIQKLAKEILHIFSILMSGCRLVDPKEMCWSWALHYAVSHCQVRRQMNDSLWTAGVSYWKYF